MKLVFVYDEQSRMRNVYGPFDASWLRLTLRLVLRLVLRRDGLEGLRQTVLVLQKLRLQRLQNIGGGDGATQLL